MILTILKSFMFWKYRWITIISDNGTRLHGIVRQDTWEDIEKQLLDLVRK